MSLILVITLSRLVFKDYSHSLLLLPQDLLLHSITIFILLCHLTFYLPPRRLSYTSSEPPPKTTSHFTPLILQTLTSFIATTAFFFIHFHNTHPRSSPRTETRGWRRRSASNTRLMPRGRRLRTCVAAWWSSMMEEKHFWKQ